MKDWLSRGVAMILLRSGPEELRGDRTSLFTALLCYLLAGALLLGLRGEQARILPILVLDLGIVLGFTVLALRLAGRTARIPQTLEALWLVGALLSLAAVPLAPGAAGAGEEPTGPQAVAITLSLVISFWSVAVMAHILRRALEWPFHRALALAILYFLGNVVVHVQFFTNG